MHSDGRQFCTFRVCRIPPPTKEIITKEIITKEKENITKGDSYFLFKEFLKIKGEKDKEPTAKDIENFDALLRTYSSQTILDVINWAVACQFKTDLLRQHLTSNIVRRQFAQWVEESGIGHIDFQKWLELHPNLDYRKTESEIARQTIDELHPELFIKACQEAKKAGAKLTAEDEKMYQKAMHLQAQKLVQGLSGRMVPNFTKMKKENNLGGKEK